MFILQRDTDSSLSLPLVGMPWQYKPGVYLRAEIFSSNQLGERERTGQHIENWTSGGEGQGRGGESKSKSGQVDGGRRKLRVRGSCLYGRGEGERTVRGDERNAVNGRRPPLRTNSTRKIQPFSPLSLSLD